MEKIKFIFLTVILVSCHSIKRISTDPKYLYQESIVYSMSPSSNKVYKDLVVISPENNELIRKKINGEDYIKVVTWKQNISFYEPYLDSIYYNTEKYALWVTTAPELLQRMKKENSQNVDLRLKQLLGLPPNSTYSYFVEFWVQPEDLFRPCPDKEITDRQCDLCFSEQTDSTHISWINDNRVSRYYQCELYKNYPWTQLGYTYDWNAENISHVGLSEFVIGSDKNIIVHAIYSTEEYLNSVKVLK